MDFYGYIFNFSVLMPIYSTLSGILFLFLIWRKSIKGKSIYVPLLVHFLGIALVWFGVSSFYMIPGFPGFKRCFTYFAALLVPVSVYHFTYNLTAKRTDKKFCWIHYLIPLSIFLSSWFRYVEFSEIKLVRFIFSLVYAVLVILRIRSYKRALPQDVFYDKTYSLSWVNTLIVIGLTIIAITLIANFLPFSSEADRGRFFLILSAWVVTFQVFFLLIYTYRVNYEFLQEIKEKINLEDNEDEIVTSTDIEQAGLLSSDLFIEKDHFEQYIRQNKPYLNSQLKLADLAEIFNTNRTYLSVFINKTYGISFISYINYLRMKEYEYLISLPENKKFNIQELIFRAGFTNYQQYSRTKKQIKATFSEKEK